MKRFGAALLIFISVSIPISTKAEDYDPRLVEDIGRVAGLEMIISSMAELCPSISFNQTDIRSAFSRWKNRHQNLVTRLILLLFREAIKDNMLPAEVQQNLMDEALETKQKLWTDMKKDRQKWEKICAKLPSDLDSGVRDLARVLPNAVSHILETPL
jgi:hypothetical protein